METGAADWCEPAWDMLVANYDVPDAVLCAAKFVHNARIGVLWTEVIPMFGFVPGALLIAGGAIILDESARFMDLKIFEAVLADGMA